MDDAGLCPYLEREDARCDNRLTLKQIGEAFKYCVCDHQTCSVFARIRAEERSTLAATPARRIA